MRHDQHVLFGASAALLAAVLAVAGVAFSQAGPGIITAVAGENSCFTRELEGC